MLIPLRLLTLATGIAALAACGPSSPTNEDFEPVNDGPQFCPSPTVFPQTPMLEALPRRGTVTFWMPAQAPFSFTGRWELRALGSGIASGDIDNEDLVLETLTGIAEADMLVIEVMGKSEACGDSALLTRRYALVDMFDASEDAPDRFVGTPNTWAASWSQGMRPNDDVDPMFADYSLALGEVSGLTNEAVSLGNGGSLVLELAETITRNAGPDIVVYENAFNETFLELGIVAVSSDCQNFAGFDFVYLGTEPVAAFGAHDAQLTTGLAGKYRVGVGTAFDTDVLATHHLASTGVVDLDFLRCVRVTDVSGNGEVADVLGHPVYDPYPTVGSSGFDLDAVGSL